MSGIVQSLFVIVVISCSTTALKTYSGIRVHENSQRTILQYEQTVAIVETGKNRTLYTCELIEVQTNEEKKTTLSRLYEVIPKKPIRLKFEQMMDLMKRCSQIAEPIQASRSRKLARPERTMSSIFGIFPGTKWCGSGDVAANYFDLGKESNVDKCCRAHDICPVKVLGKSKNYGLQNDGQFTISHCACDTEFHSCLKSTKNQIANAMGLVYFNLLGGNCLYRQNNLLVQGEKPRY